MLSRRGRIPVFANEGTFLAGDERLKKLFQRREFQTGDAIALQDLEVRSFRISHDARDPVGFVIDSGPTRLGYCTDTGKVTLLMKQRLQNCQGLILEFNHDLQLLAQGPYPLSLQQRVRSNQGHLANCDAAAFLRELQHDGLKQVVLAHLSEVNNLPELAIREARSVVEPESPTEIVLAGDSIIPPACFSLICLLVRPG